VKAAKKAETEQQQFPNEENKLGHKDMENSTVTVSANILCSVVKTEQQRKGVERQEGEGPGLTAFGGEDSAKRTGSVDPQSLIKCSRGRGSSCFQGGHKSERKQKTP